MDERIEATFGAVFLAIAVVLGLGAHYRGSAGAESGAPRGPTLLPRDAFRLEVPAFGPPATDAELAILAPLREGAELDGWIVEGIDAVTDGIVTVHLLHGESRINLQVARAAGTAVTAPASTGSYVVFATHLHGADARGTTATSLAESLGRVLEANAGVPVPEGLGPYAAHDPSAP